ncbi:MAG: CHAP domain-containing protein [Polyangiaceae bacterium]|nr:CHAP domain-containing protein [Polyangiaceae bacterium]
MTDRPSRMWRVRAARHLLLVSGLLFGCSSLPDASESVSTVEDALSVCDETVPTDRFVDGIPAYEQCAASQNSAIYSNNGVDTSTSAEGGDWVRTQWSGGYQCTELAHRYLYFRWDVQWIPNGNAGTWCDGQPPSSAGVVQTSAPVHGDVIVFPPGQCGADSVYGHVALVDTVDSATRVTIVEQNRAGRRATNISCAACFLHVVANDGSVQGSGGAAGAGGAAPATGGASVPTGGSFLATGGYAPATGGVPSATGGSSVGSGGAQVSSGGATPATGGAPVVSTGGRLNGAGGARAGTGGVVDSSGGRVANGGASFGTGGVARGTGGVSSLPSGGANPGVGGSAAIAGSGSQTGGAANAAGGSAATGTDGGPTGGFAEEETAGSGEENAAPRAADAEEATDDLAGCGCAAAGTSAPARSTPTHLGLLVLVSAVARGRRRAASRQQARAGAAPTRRSW